MLRRQVAFLLCLCALGFGSAPALGAEPGPVWKIVAVSNPTNFRPGDQTGTDAIVVTAVNIGGASTDGSPITISDSLPAGLTLAPDLESEPGGGFNRTFHAIQGIDAYQDPIGNGGDTRGEGGEVEGPPFGLSCIVAPALQCTTSRRVDSGDTLVVTIRVDVDSHAQGLGEVNSASVSGGDAATASVSDPVTISPEQAKYGVDAGSLFASTSTHQAGGHPNVTAGFFLNTINPKGEQAAERARLMNPQGFLASEPVGEPKAVGFDLPPGLVGTTVGMPRCTMAEVSNESNCPRDAMVGTATLIVNAGPPGRLVITTPVFNIAPAPGEPAAFGFDALYFTVRLDTSVLSDGDYGVRVTAPDLTAGGADYASIITFWGVPADHNGPGPDAATRNPGGNEFLETPGEKPELSFGGPGVEEYENDGLIITVPDATRVPFLSNPTQCASLLTGMLETDSWEGGAEAEAFPPAPPTTVLGTDTGCSQLSFGPSVSMLPDSLEAGAPAGYSFDLSVPQDVEADGLATPDVKRTVVTLPLGTVVSPSAADGLGACSDAEFELHSGRPGGCPRDSQVGTVRVKTPALEERLNGDVFLASPDCDPCSAADAQDGRMIRLFVQFVGEGEDGVVVKLEGTGQINQQTGQITTTFNETPQLPFSDFQLTLQGGERATLSNPRSCGSATTTADITPWSTPYTPDATASSTFNVSENCFGAQFDPSFSAGTTSNQAGGFSPFTVSFGRGDSDEFLNGIQVRMPAGLVGMLSKVKLCEEPEAAEGTCGPESQIGETDVETGPGADPFLVTGGKVFITGPYKGAPYGLSIVVPAKAGPYTLSGTTGNGTVVNRSAINVDPQTSALTVTSDPLPTELDGIPLQLRLVNVTINRPEFTFNPTSCNKMQVGATLTSTQAASANESSSFQVTNCAGLKFQPKFSVSTSGRTSKTDGASLDTKVTFPSLPQGSEANIARVKVELPKQLPSRLTTLQKACTAAVFNANPGGCPAASIIGIAKVSTPVLPVQLTGPVYFVSNGGEAFPNLEIVLQGDGVRVDLVGDTFISKGITSTTFKTLPDVPFSTFELYLPEGRYSALAANGNLCTTKLSMPNEFIAQNGTAIHQTSKLAITGCPKPKKAATKVKKPAKKASKAGKASGVGSARKAGNGQGSQS